MRSITATSGYRRAYNSRVGNSYPPAGLHLDAVCPDLRGSDRTADWDGKYVQAAARRRQFSLLADMVSLFEPEQAERLTTGLLNRFGSLGKVFAASCTSIDHVVGNEALANMISTAREAVLEGLLGGLVGAPFDPRNPEIRDYICARAQAEPEESLFAIFLDCQRRFIRDEQIAKGSWDSIEVRLRPLLRRALELNSAFVVLLHNHPSGDPKPSKSDKDFTARAQLVCRELGIEIIDHLIVAKRKTYSMRLRGCIS